jgi:hypothetical protein
MTRFFSNTKSNLFVISLYIAFLFVVLQYLSFDPAGAQSTNKIEYVFNIEQMKGHLEQTVKNKENGNNSLSQAHIHHLIVEIYDFMEVQLGTADSNLNTLLFN